MDAQDEAHVLLEGLGPIQVDPSVLVEASPPPLAAPSEPAAHGKELRKLVEEGAERFWRWRDAASVEAAFWNHAEPSKGKICSAESFSKALGELGVVLVSGEAAAAMRLADLDGDGALNLQEFLCAARQDSSLAQWASGIPLGGLLGHCLSFCAIGAASAKDDPLMQASLLTDEQLDVVVDVYKDGVTKLLKIFLLELRDGWKAMRMCGTEEGKVVRCQWGGSAVDKGWSLPTESAHIGSGAENVPINRQGQAGFPLGKAMEEEHCAHVSSDAQFHAGRRLPGHWTTPRQEYEIVVGRRENPRPSGGEDEAARRVVRRLEDLQATELAVRSGVSAFEIMAMMLFTGPMGQVYNTILRKYPNEDFLRFKAGENEYSTTIFVLISAMTKISRAAKFLSRPALYIPTDGLNSVANAFAHWDLQGRRVALDRGFLTATSDAEIALQRAGACFSRECSSPLVVVLCVAASSPSEDAPARVSEFSQYPDEMEFVWMPATRLELSAGPSRVSLVRGRDGKTKGVARMLEVLVQSSAKPTETIEESRDRRKRRHLEIFQSLIADLAHDIDDALKEDTRTVASKRAVPTKRHAASSALTSAVGTGLLSTDTPLIALDGGGAPPPLVPVSVSSPLAAAAATRSQLASRLVREVEAVRAQQAAAPSEAFRGETYRALAAEMLAAPAAALSALRLVLDHPAAAAAQARASMYAGRRALLTLLWKRLPPPLPPGSFAGRVADRRAEVAGRLCRLMGLVGPGGLEGLDMEGFSPLMRAASDGAGARALECLVAAGAQVDRRDGRGQTALYKAAACGHADGVAVLARLGADVNTAAEPGFEITPLWMAAQEGYVEVVEVLVRLRADTTRASRDGRTPLYMAAERGHLPIMESLVQSFGSTVGGGGGGDWAAGLVDRADREGFTPLAMASAGGRRAVVEELGRLRANVNLAASDMRSPLYLAAERGHADVVRLLGALKADLAQAAGGGATPLHAAAGTGQLPVVEALLALGADPDAPSDYGPPLLLAGSYPAVQAALRGAGATVTTPPR